MNGETKQELSKRDGDIGLQRFCVSTVVQDTSAATAANYGVFFTALFSCELIEAWETHKTAGTNGSAVTLALEKLEEGDALGSGVDMLDSTFNLKGTINTPQRVRSTTTRVNRVLSPGERVALKDAGTLTDVAHVQVTLLFRILSYRVSSSA